MATNEYSLSTAAEALSIEVDDVEKIIAKGLMRGRKSPEGILVSEREIERIRALQARGVSLPTKKNSIEWAEISTLFGQVLRSLPNLLERDSSNAILRGNVDLRFVLATQTRVVEQTAVLLMRSLDEAETASREEGLIALQPLVRTLLESVITFAFVLEDPSPRLQWFFKGGWWNVRAELERYEAEYSSDPGAQAFLDMLRKSLLILEAMVKPSPDDRSRKPARDDYWPNPGRLRDLVSSEDLRKYLHYLNAWMYGELSSASHLALIGVRDAGAFLRVLKDADERYLAIARVRSDIAFRTIGLTLAAYSEVECGLRGLDPVLRMKLLELWRKLLPLQEEIRDLFELRYSTTLLEVKST